MIEATVAILTVALIFVFSVRHFFVQVLALKLLMDALILLLACSRGQIQNSFTSQSMAIFLLSISGALFFVLMASGIRRFAKSRSLDLEGRGD